MNNQYNPDRLELLKIILTMADMPLVDQEKSKVRLQELAAKLEPKK